MIRGLSALNVPNPPSFIGRQGNFVGSRRFDMYPFYNALSMCLFHRNDGYKFSDLPELIERSYDANVGFGDLISNLNNNDCEILLGNIYDYIRYNYSTMTTQDMSVIQDITTSIFATRTIDLKNRERDVEYISNELSALSQSLNLINASKDIGIRARIRRESFTFNI